jgi:hypothetical protein
MRMQVECSRGVKLVADVAIGDVADAVFDCIACPVGMTTLQYLLSCGRNGSRHDAMQTEEVVRAWQFGAASAFCCWCHSLDPERMVCSLSDFKRPSYALDSSRMR